MADVLSRRGLLRGLFAAPAIIMTPGLLMPIKPGLITAQASEVTLEPLDPVPWSDGAVGPLDMYVGRKLTVRHAGVEIEAIVTEVYDSLRAGSIAKRCVEMRGRGIGGVRAINSRFLGTRREPVMVDGQVPVMLSTFEMRTTIQSSEMRVNDPRGPALILGFEERVSMVFELPGQDGLPLVV